MQVVNDGARISIQIYLTPKPVPSPLYHTASMVREISEAVILG